MPLPPAFKSFHITCKSGNPALIRQAWDDISIDTRQEIFSLEHYLLFRSLCGHADIEVVQWFWSQCPEEEKQLMLRSMEDDALCAAIEANRQDTVTWLWSQYPQEAQQTLLQAAAGRVIQTACAQGDLTLVQRLWDWSQPDYRQSLISVNQYEPFVLAAGNGHIAIARWLWEQYEPAHKDKILSLRPDAFYHACEKGDRALISWLLSLCQPAQQLVLLQAKHYKSIQNTLLYNRDIFHFFWEMPGVQEHIIAWWLDIVAGLPSAGVSQSIQEDETIAALFANPTVLNMLEQRHNIAEYIQYFRAEKQAYFRAIQTIYDAKHQYEQCVRESGLPQAGDSESAMRKEELRQAVLIQAEVFQKTQERYEAFGETDEGRLAKIERRIRDFLLTQLELVVPDSLKHFIRTHRHALVLGDVAAIHEVTQQISQLPDVNEMAPYLAWRSYDAQAETSEEWPNLFTEPDPTQASKTCFSTAEAHEGALSLGEAVRLSRELAARYFLICDEEVQTRLNWLFYMAEIRRSHNETILGVDSPSCYPGIMTRLPKALRTHPAYEHYFHPADQLLILQAAFSVVRNRALQACCASLQSEAEKWAYYDALAAIRPASAIKVLSDDYIAAIGEIDLPSWVSKRTTLQAAILAEYGNRENFITGFLSKLHAEGQIQRILPVDRAFVAYLLEALVISEADLSDCYHQLDRISVEPMVPPILFANQSETMAGTPPSPNTRSPTPTP